MNVEEILANDIIVTAITFAQDGLDISYFDKRKQSPVKSLGEVLGVAVDDSDQELFALYQQLQEIAIYIIEHQHAADRHYKERMENEPQQLTLGEEHGH